MNVRIAGDVQTQNRCLAALSSEAFALLKPHMKDVVLDAGSVLWEPGERQRQTYFPASGLASITLPMQDGATIEVGLVGGEGAAGSLDSVRDVTTRGTVLIGGAFTQILTDTLIGLARQNRELALMLDLCRDWALLHAQQLAACNAAHPADKRLCRWLTACQRRISSGRIDATQEMIGALLGVRRTTVTLLAQKLHNEGLIDYTRGKISVRDADGLAAAACECCGNLDSRHWPSTRFAAMWAEEQT